MIEWHKNEISTLSKGIVAEVDYWQRLLKQKDDEIYGVSLITDDDALTVYLAVSSKKLLKTKHKHIKWTAYLWELTITDPAILPEGVDAFSKEAVKRILDRITPKDDFDCAAEREGRRLMQTEAMKLAKTELIEKYGQDFKEVIFFLTIFGDPEISIVSAKQINENSPLLEELLMDNLF